VLLTAALDDQRLGIGCVATLGEEDSMPPLPPLDHRRAAGGAGYVLT